MKPIGHNRANHRDLANGAAAWIIARRAVTTHSSVLTVEPLVHNRDNHRDLVTGTEAIPKWGPLGTPRTGASDLLSLRLSDRRSSKWLQGGQSLCSAWPFRMEVRCYHTLNEPNVRFPFVDMLDMGGVLFMVAIIKALFTKSSRGRPRVSRGVMLGVILWMQIEGTQAMQTGAGSLPGGGMTQVAVGAAGVLLGLGMQQPHGQAEQEQKADPPKRGHKRRQDKGPPRPPTSSAPPPLWGGDPMVAKLGMQSQAADSSLFRGYFKNVCGRDPIREGWLHELLDTMVLTHTDVVTLVDLKGDDGKLLTPLTASILRRAVHTYVAPSLKTTPFVAEIAYDQKDCGGRSGVLMIYRTELRLRSVTTDEEGRWLHAELCAQGNRSVHLLGAYAHHGSVSGMHESTRATHERMLAAIVPRVVDLPLPPSQRPSSSPCGKTRQGVAILFADTNSVFRENDRPKGWNLGGNGLRVTSEPREPHEAMTGPRDLRAGTNGRDGPGSLAWELRGRGAVSVVPQRHGKRWSEGPHRLRSWLQRAAPTADRASGVAPKGGARPIRTWALIDHIIVASGPAYRALRYCGVDAQDSFIWGSDHRGVMAAFHFCTLFGETKSEMYARPAGGSAAPAVPKFTDVERAFIRQRMSTTKTRWLPEVQRVGAEVAALPPGSPIAPGEVTKLWTSLHDVFRMAWDSILDDRLALANRPRQPPRGAGVRRDLIALRSAQRVLYLAPTASLAALVASPTTTGRCLRQTYHAVLPLLYTLGVQARYAIWYTL